MIPGLILRIGTTKTEVALWPTGGHVAASLRFIETDTQRRQNKCGSKDNVTQLHNHLNTRHHRNEVIRKEHHAGYHGQRDGALDSRQHYERTGDEPCRWHGIAKYYGFSRNYVEYFLHGQLVTSRVQPPQG